MQPVQDLTVEDRVSRTQFQYTLEDPDPAELGVWVPKFVDKLKTLPELRDVASDQQNAGLQEQLVIDRAAASRLGITPQMIDDALYNAFGQRQVSTMFTQVNQYHVVLEVKRKFQQTPDNLHDIYLRTAAGGTVPLDTLTRVEHATVPLAINHQGQFPVVTVSFNLAPDVAGRRRQRRRTRPRTSWLCPPASRPSSRAPPRPSAPRWSTSRSWSSRP